MAVVHEVHQDLTEALVEIRDSSEKEAYRIADRLLDRDKFKREMIGIEASGDRAIFYDHLMRSIKALPFNEDGFNGWDIRRVKESKREWNRMNTRENDPLAWFHLRYRWL